MPSDRLPLTRPALKRLDPWELPVWSSYRTELGTSGCSKYEPLWHDPKVLLQTEAGSSPGKHTRLPGGHASPPIKASSTRAFDTLGSEGGLCSYAGLYFGSLDKPRRRREIRRAESHNLNQSTRCSTLHPRRRGSLSHAKLMSFSAAPGERTVPSERKYCLSARSTLGV